MLSEREKQAPLLLSVPHLPAQASFLLLKELKCFKIQNLSLGDGVTDGGREGWGIGGRAGENTGIFTECIYLTIYNYIKLYITV